MPEQYANVAKTTLTANYTAGDGIIHVASTNTPFPQACPFSISVRNTNETINKVLLRVTSIDSSTQWSVTAEGTDANALNGDHVVGTQLTALAIDGIRADVITKGAYASLPAAVDKKKGDLYFPTDSIFKFLHNGSAWVPLVNDFFPTVPPAVSGLTWVNQGGASTDETKGGIILTVPSGNSSVNQRALVKSKTGNYTFTVGMRLIGFQGNYFHAGLIVRESSSGKIVKFGPWGGAVFGLSVDYYTTATSFSSEPHNESYWMNSLFYRVVKDASNWTFYASPDGINFTQFHQIAVASLFSSMVPNQIGITVDSENSGEIRGWFFHWEEA